METTLLNTLEKLISDYNTKSLSPTWFRELSKTLLSKNISMEDWNTSQHYLKNLAAQNEALYEFCQSITEVINASNISIAAKLDRVETTSTCPRLYGVSGTGVQEMRNTIDRDMPWSVPYRNNTGNFMVKDLTSDSNGSYVANKNYVDAKVQQAITGALKEDY